MAKWIDQAIILAAGQGTRLRQDQQDYLKPLYPLQQKPLIAHVMEGFLANQVARFTVVVGFEKQEVMPGIQKALPPGCILTFVDNPDWRLNNGVSLFKAKHALQERFFLSMADHLFQHKMVRILGEGALEEDCLYLAVDRKIDTVFDLDDATKVRTDGTHILAIGKQLDEFDAIDTGLFVCPPSIFSYLEQAMPDGDCSLSDGVMAMAKDNKARVVDIGDAWWQDVDTPEMLSHSIQLLDKQSQ